MAILTPEQISQLGKLMDKRFAREMAEITTVTARLRDERGRGDQFERAPTDIDLATSDAVVGQDNQDVRDIIAARRRMAIGTYGVCVDCGEAVGYERLLAYPTAKRCIGCQREYETGKAIRGGRPVP